jgi:hypothetical protein
MYHIRDVKHYFNVVGFLLFLMWKKQNREARWLLSDILSEVLLVRHVSITRASQKHSGNAGFSKYTMNEPYKPLLALAAHFLAIRPKSFA